MLPADVPRLQSSATTSPQALYLPSLECSYHSETAFSPHSVQWFTFVRPRTLGRSTEAKVCTCPAQSNTTASCKECVSWRPTFVFCLASSYFSVSSISRNDRIEEQSRERDSQTEADAHHKTARLASLRRRSAALNTRFINSRSKQNNSTRP